MKFVKSFMLILLILSNAISLSGCWNYHDIEKYSIVAGLAVDKNEQGDKYLITAEIIDFEMSGKDAKTTSKFVESEGKTIFEAIRSIINITGKRLYWAHAQIAVVSKDIAKEGIAPVIDLLFRDPEVREEMNVVISREKTASEVLKEKPMIEMIHSFDINTILKNETSNIGRQEVQVYELVNMLAEEGISPALPAVGISANDGNKTGELMGMAVLKKDRLVGFFDIEESKYYNFVIDKFDKGLLVLNENPENKVSNISLEVFKNKTKVKPEYHDGKLTMNIHINTEVAIAEIGTSTDYIDGTGREKLKKDAEQALKTSVEKVIKKVQNEYDSDIFGFGMLVKADIPSLWKEIHPNWDNLFKNLEVNVNVDISIKNSAIASKTIKVGE